MRIKRFSKRKVFILKENELPYEDWTILGVFFSRESAEVFLEQRKNKVRSEHTSPYSLAEEYYTWCISENRLFEVKDEI